MESKPVGYLITENEKKMSYRDLTNLNAMFFSDSR